MLYRDWKQTIISIVLTAGLSFILFTQILIPVRTPEATGSHFPYFGSIDFIFTFAYLFSDPQRGDVVAVRLAGKQVVHIRRIIGLPEEQILLLLGQVFIDGTLLPEPYILKKDPWNIADQKTTSNEFFVMGDVRVGNPYTQDIGRVKQNRIIGKLIVSSWN